MSPTDSPKVSYEIGLFDVSIDHLKDRSRVVKYLVARSRGELKFVLHANSDFSNHFQIADAVEDTADDDWDFDFVGGGKLYFLQAENAVALMDTSKDFGAEEAEVRLALTPLVNQKLGLTPKTAS